MPDVKVTKETAGPLASRPETYFPNFPFDSLLGATPFSASPFNLIKRFGEDFDRMFGAFVPPVAEIFALPLEVKHVAGVFTVTAELPGVVIADIKLQVIEEALVIEGEKKTVKEEKTEGFFRSERAFGKFYRSIPLPRGAKTDLVKAELVNGILTVTIPVPEVKPALRRVPITAK
jgi:HSP20 family protein